MRNRCALRCVARLGSIDPPGIILHSDSAVALKITPPEGVTNSTLRSLTYIIMYRKHTSSEWRLTSEDSSVSRIVKHLESDTLYEFKVVAKYKGQTSTSDRASTRRTKRSRRPKGKCMLYFSFSAPIVLIT